MVIVYDAATGDLKRFIVGRCLNADTHQADGYLVINPGGRFPDVDAGEAVFNLDELTDPVLADDAARAIYDETNRYYIANLNGVLSLVESV